MMCKRWEFTEKKAAPQSMSDFLQSCIEDDREHKIYDYVLYHE